MANPPKDKGRTHENRVVEWLQPIFPNAARDGTNSMSQDIYGVPFPVEVKHRKSWDLKGWLRKLKDAASDHDRYPFQPEGYDRWVLFARDDARKATTTAIGDAVVLPREFALELLEVWERESRDWIQAIGNLKRGHDED